MKSSIMELNCKFEPEIGTEAHLDHFGALAVEFSYTLSRIWKILLFSFAPLLVSSSS